MSLKTYSGLIDAVIFWSKREDANKGNRIDDYIELCEEKIYSNELESLRIKEMDTRATAVTLTTERFLPLPDGFLDMRRLKINDQLCDIDVRYRAPDQLEIIPVSDRPSFFTVTSQIGFDRIPDQEYEIEMQYFATLDPVTESNPTNDILTKFPSIYLNGTLWALWQSFSEEQARAEYYYGKFLAAIVAVNKSEKKSRYGPTPVIKKERRQP